LHEQAVVRNLQTYVDVIKLVNIRTTPSALKVQK
jgi:hypothetical protein